MDFSTHNKFHSELFFYIFIWQLDCNLAAQLFGEVAWGFYFVYYLSKTQYTPLCLQNQKVTIQTYNIYLFQVAWNDIHNWIFIVIFDFDNKWYFFHIFRPEQLQPWVQEKALSVLWKIVGKSSNAKVFHLLL